MVAVVDSFSLAGGVVVWSSVVDEYTVRLLMFKLVLLLILL